MKTRPDQNRALVLEAFDTLFNKRDYEAPTRLWSDTYIHRELESDFAIANDEGAAHRLPTQRLVDSLWIIFRRIEKDLACHAAIDIHFIQPTRRPAPNAPSSPLQAAQLEHPLVNACNV